MWVITTRGFYSVVQHRTEPNKVLVRARCEEDIRALEDIVGIEPFSLDSSDYEWRIEMPMAVWLKAMTEITLDIDYDNFKNAVKDAQGSKRANVYMSVWSVLLRLEKGRKKVWKSALTGKFKCSECGDRLYSNEDSCWRSTCDGERIRNPEWGSKSKAKA
jgi:hypothetical protein